MDGALMEVGPYRVREGGHLEYNNGSWDEFANLLFVDQPVGTGFSYVNTDSYLSELDQMADHMVIFLEKFFALFPEYENDDVSTQDTYVAGGHLLTRCSCTLPENRMLDNTFRTLLAPSSTATSRTPPRAHGRSRVS